MLQNTSGGCFCGSKPRENYSQLTFTCSKSAIEILKKGVKICSKLTMKTQNDVNWFTSFPPDLINFTSFISVSIVEFEQLIVSWVYWILELLINSIRQPANYEQDKNHLSAKFESKGKNNISQKSLVPTKRECRGVSRNPSDIYDGDLLRK